MKLPFAEVLRDRNPVLMDGALGTQLMEKGLAAGEAPERWNVDHPDRVSEVHASYFAAGSHAVTTNSFGANRLKLQAYGLEARLEELNRQAVALARSVCPPEGYVAAGMGPTGKFLKPFGPLTPEELVAIYAEQAAVLATAGADFILVETMYDLEEALAALRAIKKATRLPVAISLTYDRKPKGFFTLMGNSPPEALRRLQDAGADAAGANCTLPSAAMKALARLLRDSTTLPLVVQPNKGKPRVLGGTVAYDESDEVFAANLVEIRGYGVEIVGGCCGTHPGLMASVSRALVHGHRPR